MSEKSEEQKAHDLKFYQVEVLDKLEGKPWRAPGDEPHPQAGLFYVLALHAPVQVEAALQATQDQRQRNLYDGMAKHVKNLGAYYLATVRNMCREQNIHVPVRWKQ
jgi:hypothetical protein